MTDWGTVAFVSLILPIDAVLVSYLMALWIKHEIKKIWTENEKKKKKKWFWQK